MEMSKTSMFESMVVDMSTLEEEYIQRCLVPMDIPENASIEQVLNIDADNLLRLKVVTTEDWEVEFECTRTVFFQEEDEYGFPITLREEEVYLNDGSSIKHAVAYWTRMGEDPNGPDSIVYRNPETGNLVREFIEPEIWTYCVDQATQNDRRSRNLNEVFPPEKNFYSVSGAWSRDRWLSQWRNYNLISVFIFKNTDNKALLRKAWNRMWKRVYAEKSSFLWQSHIRSLVKEFNSRGITPRNQ
jgi:hypothetical protein